MHENDKAVLVYTTFPSADAAEAVGNALVEAGLAACVNILPGMTSIYVWKGVRHRDSEVVMIIKTRSVLSGQVVAETKSRHPYDNPAILVLPVEGGSGTFLAWIATQTEQPSASDADEQHD